MRRCLVSLLLLLLCISCGEEKKPVAYYDSVRKAAAATLAADGPENDIGEFTENIRCEDLANKDIMIQLASAEAPAVSPFLFSYGIDSSGVETWNRRFFNAKELTTAVLVKGMSNWVNGPAHALMFFRCEGEMARLAVIENIGDPDYIGDIDGDSITEIVFHDEFMHFGVLYNTIEIVRFRNEKKETLFFTQSELPTDTSFFTARFGKIQPGDTIGFETKLEFSKTGAGRVKIVEIRDYSLFKGGTITGDNLEKFIYHKTDTLEVIPDGRHNRKGVM